MCDIICFCCDVFKKHWHVVMVAAHPTWSIKHFNTMLMCSSHGRSEQWSSSLPTKPLSLAPALGKWASLLEWFLPRFLPVPQRGFSLATIALCLLLCGVQGSNIKDTLTMLVGKGLVCGKKAGQSEDHAYWAALWISPGLKGLPLSSKYFFWPSICPS